MNAKQETKRSKYIIKVSAARMPGSCWGRYAHIAVLEVEPNVKTVSMISSRAKGVISVVRYWDRLNCGSTERCAFARAMKEAKQLCAELNAEAKRIM